MEEILEITKEVLELFSKKDLTKIQGMFIIKAVEISLQEEIIKEAIEDSRRASRAPGIE